MKTRYLFAIAASVSIACGTLPPCAHATDVIVVAGTRPADPCAVSWGVFHPYPYFATRAAACVAVAATYYPAAYGYGYWTAYPAYWAAYTRPYAAYGVAYGPAGVAAWGPYGGVAATTGTVTTHNGAYRGAQRASAAYNPWTGNGAAQRTRAAYNADTGMAAVGQQGAAANAYNGNYGAGERGAVVNTNTGAAAAGSRGTVGNAYTGNQAQTARGAVYNPATGRVSSAAGVKGENGGVARVNDNVYVGRNGNVRQVTPRARPAQAPARRRPVR